MIGQFREKDPPNAIARKRQLDCVFFANEHLFTLAFRQKYKDFMGKCFDHWGSPGEDAKMMGSAQRLRAYRGTDAAWDNNWDRLFVSGPDSSGLRHEQAAAYDGVMSAFAAELRLARDDRPSSLTEARQALNVR